MRTIRALTLNPTGNITCLVLDPVSAEEEKAVTARLMAGRCEQVAYLEPATEPPARARIRLMGGEFCGNAAMAAACYLAREEGWQAGQAGVIPLQVSGAAGVLACRVERLGDAWEGTVPMPGLLSVAEVEVDGERLTAVRLEGILHLIREAEAPLEDGEAEKLLRGIALRGRDEAVGLLQWNPAQKWMRPLVYVRGSNTLVWETGCGSGSAAVGAREALRQGDGIHRVEIGQPGGIIRAEAAVEDAKITRLTISGRVIIEGEAPVQVL